MSKTKLNPKLRNAIVVVSVFAIAVILPNLMMGFLSGIGVLVGIVNMIARNAYDGFMSQITETATFNDIFMVLYSCICIGIFLYYLKTKGGLQESESAAWKDGWIRKAAACLVLVPGMQFLTDYIYNGIYALKPEWITAFENSTGTSASTDISILFLLYTLILSPISEEMIFRGILQKELKCLTGHFWIANTIQAVLFGVFHGNMVQGIYTFVMGLFFGLVCEKGGSLVYSILLHMLFNAASMFVMEPLWKLIPDSTAGNILVAAVTIASVVPGLILLMYKIKRQDREMKCASAE